MSRLDQLRQELNELKAARTAERDELRGYGERDDDLNEVEDARCEELFARFGGDGRWAEQDKIDALEGRISRHEAILNAQEPVQERVGLTVFTPSSDTGLERGAEWARPEQVIDSARRALDKGIVELDDKYRANVHQTLTSIHGDRAAVARHIIATGRVHYRSAFTKVMDALARGLMVPNGLTSEEADALDQVRAASLTDAAGGYAVPVTLDPTLILTGAHDGGLSQWRQLATVKQTTTDTWSGVTSAGVTAHWYGEAQEVSDDSPTLTSPTITPKKASAFIPFSVEIQGDWAGMENDFRMMFAVARDDLEATAFSSATAISNGPDGLIYGLDGTSAEISPTTPETFALADVYKLVSAVPARFRSRSAFLGDYATYGTIRQFDTAGGGALWTQLAADQPAVLLGRPAYEEPNLRSTADINGAVVADNFILVFGDFSRFYIVDRVGMSVELIPHLFHTANNRPSLQRGLVAWWRTGSKVIDTGAFAVLNVATS